MPVVRDFYEFTLTEQTMVVLVGNGNGTSLPVTEIFSGSVASDVGLTSTAKIGGLRTTEAKEVRTPVLLAAGNYVMAVGAAGADANSLPELGAYTVSLESRTEDNHLACFTGTYFIGRGISTNQTLESGDCEFSTGPGESTRLDSYIIRSSGGGSVTYSVESLTPGLDVQLMAWRDGQFDVPLHQSILGTNLSGTFTLPFGQPWVQIQVVTRSPTNGAPPAAGNYRLTIN